MILDCFSLKGKIAVVTGGNTGLGYEMARALAQAEAGVIVTSRSLERAQEAAQSIAAERGGWTAGLALDQSSLESVEAMADAAYSFHHRIDILINNAGGGAGSSDGDFMAREPSALSAMIAGNLTGVLHCCQAVGRYLVEQGSGKIINVGSVAGMVGRDRQIYKDNGRNQQPVEYAAAKGGVIALSRDLAAYLGPYGVTVNTLSPGIFNKGELSQGFDQDSAKKIPLGRTGKPGPDITGPVLFLCSAASDYMNGHNLVVDGGFTIYK